ncbi:uncharacterized protein SCHCODRAFT_02599416 [Schizophyllum commune H4-8]|uniref:uncharacterized protein n=1 Tax=Schizophyllum commune (strain H4-8 / FGSC 9210) TaxID=578458 RepID=UPI00216019E1|nr:uncharacterized protein SCHCODRAFT_02599416 [Schizophyllum commune H4-8]KAI5894240.1 hypothetical protein SCHCODRAFT_02599416 [Schizophyllum commune H4-8]
MGVDRPITEFFKPLKENKRGHKRRREQEDADESPGAKARKAGSSKASSCVLRSTVTANKIKNTAPLDANRIDESAGANRREVGPSSSVSPPSIGIGRSSSKPLLLDAGTSLSTPIGSRISALTLHTPPLTGHPPEKRPTVGDARVAAATKRFPDRHALPTPVTLPRRRTSRESPPPGPKSSQDPPSSPPFKFPFRISEEIVPSSQPTQDWLRSPRKPASHNRGDDTVFKVPRTPVSRRRWDDEVPSSQSPIALDSDDCVGTSQSQERFPLLGWRSRSTSPVKSRSPVKPISRHEVASSVADEDTSYQRMLGGSQPLSSPHRQVPSSPPGSPASRPLSQYTETEPGSYDYLWNLRSAEGEHAEEDTSRSSKDDACSQSSSQTVPGTYDDRDKWPTPLPSRTKLRVKTSVETQLSTTSPLEAQPRVRLQSETQPSATPAETQPSAPSSGTQSSATPAETPSSSPQLSPTQPMTCDLWTAEDFAHLRKNAARGKGKTVARGEGKSVARKKGNEDDAQGSRDGEREAHDEEHEAHDKESEVHDEEASQAEVNDSQAQFDDSQAGLDDSFGSDFSLGLYAGEGSFPDDFPESLKL